MDIILLQQKLAAIFLVLVMGFRPFRIKTTKSCSELMNNWCYVSVILAISICTDLHTLHSHLWRCYFDCFCDVKFTLPSNDVMIKTNNTNGDNWTIVSNEHQCMISIYVSCARRTGRELCLVLHICMEKIPLISLVNHICIANPSIALKPAERDQETVSGQYEFLIQICDVGFCVVSSEVPVGHTTCTSSPNGRPSSTFDWMCSFLHSSSNAD